MIIQYVKFVYINQFLVYLFFEIFIWSDDTVRILNHFDFFEWSFIQYDMNLKIFDQYLTDTLLTHEIFKIIYRYLSWSKKN